MKISDLKREVAAEFARRAKLFHPNKNPLDISLWGLFPWSYIKRLIDKGIIIPDVGFTKINRIIWCKPSSEFYENDIKPLLKASIEDLTKMAGWE